MQTQVDIERDTRDGSSGAHAPAPDIRARAIYLHTAPDPTFAVVHLPADPRPGATGVLFCPPFGWDDLCTHRSRRAWAVALADAGHPTIRIDLPDTGDSVGSPRSADRLQAWITATTAAASWLRAEQGCSRVVAIGIGFGGMLGWLAAADGAPIDDLVLWAVPTRGRRLIREQRAAAMMSIDSEVALGEFGDDRLDAGEWATDGLLDEAGQVTTRETLDAIGAIDLTATPLPFAERRHVLLLARAGVATDDQLAEHLRSIGATVTIGDGDAYGALMRYVQQSEIPRDAIAGSISWLSGVTGSRSADHLPLGLCTAAVDTSDSVVFRHDGVAIRETVVSLWLSSGHIHGVLTQPVDAAAADLSVVFFNGGSDRRIGPNRTWVNAARRWATQGVTAFRFDPPGIGDSEGDERAWSLLHDHYGQIQVDRTVELLDTLRDRGHPNRFVLIGFCSGAFRSLETAMSDKRVVGVFAIGIPFFRWTWWTVNIRESWLAFWEPKPGDSKLKATVGTRLKRLLTILQHGQGRIDRIAQAFPNRSDRIIRQLSAQGTELILMLKGHSWAYEQLQLPLRRGRLQALSAYRHVHRLPGDDQRFRPLVSQRYVNDMMDGGIVRVLAATAPPLAGPARTTSDDELIRRHARTVEQLRSMRERERDAAAAANGDDPREPSRTASLYGA